MDEADNLDLVHMAATGKGLSVGVLFKDAEAVKAIATALRNGKPMTHGLQNDFSIAPTVSGLFGGLEELV
jgi:hypothetical protein